MARWPGGFNKLAAMSALVILLAVAALSWLQYRSLSELEAKTRFAVREHVRTKLEGFRQRIEERARRIAEETLRQCDLADLKEEQLTATGQKFTSIRKAHAAVDRVFAVSQCSCRGEPFAIVSTPDGAGWIKCSRFNDPLVSDTLDSFRGARPVPERRDEMGFLYFQSGSTGKVPSGILYVFRLLPGSAKNRSEASFAGVAINSQTLLEDVLPRTTDESPADGDGIAEGLSFVIKDGSGKTVYTSGADIDVNELSVSAGPIFPLWTISGRLQGMTIETLARDQFRNGLLLSGLVLCLLMAGITLSLHATAREARTAELKSAFVSNVSHEMKTPLALIKLFAETLELGRITDADKLREYYRVIHKETRRLARLVDNVLDFAKMESGRKQYDLRPADVGDLVTDLLNGYEDQLTAADFKLCLQIQRPLPTVEVDRDAISQAVLNLLDNAVKYSADVKEIAITVSARDSEIAVEVVDKGVGIPEREQQRIFEKFYRVNTSLVHDIKGSGLGLTLTKHIVEAHHGRIEVDSRPGRGSRFAICLPVSRPRVVPGTAGALEAEPLSQIAHY